MENRLKITFPIYWLLGFLNCLGWPKTKGLFICKKFVNTIVLQEALTTVIRCGIAFGAIQPKEAIILFADFYSFIKHNSQYQQMPVKKLWNDYDPSEQIAQHPDEPPEEVIGYHSLSVPNFIIPKNIHDLTPWKKLFTEDFTAYFHGIFYQAIVWGLSCPEEAQIRYKEKQQKINKMISFGLKIDSSMITMEDIADEMLGHISVFQHNIRPFGDPPQELLDIPIVVTRRLNYQMAEKENHKSDMQQTTKTQEQPRTKFMEATGNTSFSTIPIIGQDIKWTGVIRQVFRVLEFDRVNTIVLADGTVKATTQTKPYGYLLVESPILNVKVRLPIVHRDDFILATSVYDEPLFADWLSQQKSELLVTYFPEPTSPLGTMMHVLHYVIVPQGTLERYYELNNDEHMANTASEKLFKRFAWFGEIRVEVNSAPELSYRD